MTQAILAGIIATIAVSILLIAQSYFGILPRFQLIDEWQGLLRSVGLSGEPWQAWLAHTIVGAVVFAVLFTALRPVLPGRGAVEGLAFGVVAWVLMMLIFMPLAGHGLFGVTLGWETVAATLGLHLVYGLVFGVSYRTLEEEDRW